MAIFQCAPNFSEGRDPDTLAALKEAARAPGVALADFSADADHNRCVATLLGDAPGLEEAALQMARVAVERIHLDRHAGAHPRMGALDVLPFIPFREATMEDADRLARAVGARIAGALGVPVYLYAASARDAERATLPVLRRGGFEALQEKLRAMPPDFGPSVPHPTAGATVVGSRGPLLAFNVNLDSDDLSLARRIAARLRESAGGIPGIRALGLRMADGGFVQVSVNITDVRAATLTTVYHAVQSFAAEAGVAVRGSELIGGIALDSVLAALNEAIRGEIAPGQVLDIYVAGVFPHVDGTPHRV
jgi:glutamate formiminotransferase